MALRGDFAGAPNAVKLARQLKCWDMYRKTAEAEGMCSLMIKMKQSATEAVQLAIEQGDTESQAVLEAALAEWDEPDFGLFVRAKVSGWE